MPLPSRPVDDVAADDLVLYLITKLREESGITGHADDQILVLFRMDLGIQKFFIEGSQSTTIPIYV